MKPRISMVTLGVSDLEESVRFYEQVRNWCPPSFGLVRKMKKHNQAIQPMLGPRAADA